MSVDKDPDIGLAARCAAGEPTAWEAFVRDHRPFVAAVIRIVLRRGESGAGSGEAAIDQAVDDFIGDTYARREKTLGAFRGEGSLRAYLAVLAANWARRRRRTASTSRSVGLVSAGPESAFVEVDHGIEAREEVSAVLLRLDPAERLLFQVLLVDREPPAVVARLLNRTSVNRRGPLFA
jgi:DNA-directed RNA polymerase specialized sigma24 family protein